VSNGRAAWNLVTSSLGEENFGAEELPSPEERYARATETLEVVNALWDSWEPGALRHGPDGNVILDRDRVHPISHSGRYFTVAGPLNIPPLPQRRPVQIQAGQSEGGIALGARFAEIVSTSLPTLQITQEYTTKMRSLAARHGRAPGLPLIFSSFHAVNRRRGRVEIFSGYIRAEYTLRELIVAAQDTGHWSIAGTPEQLADAIEERFRAGVLDVLSLGGLADLRQHDFIVNGLLHELRNRKIVAADYTGNTLRENLGLELPARTATRQLSPASR
jgi:alkanesulfonate monooxygenase SsuD/methylene tetrahydromethanopterin reductase-like flavin-dependent oxidoreductase (luciferase family)